MDAYASYEDYQGFEAKIIPESAFDAYAVRASLFLDTLTDRRLKTAPTISDYQVYIKLATCEIAETMWTVDQTRQTAQNAADQQAAGKASGKIASVSSGEESISYETAEDSYSKAYAEMASDSNALQKVLTDIATRYLQGIPDANGVLLMYRGVRRRGIR